jgi:hypothetical protein
MATLICTFQAQLHWNLHIRIEIETCKLGEPYPRSMPKPYPFWASGNPLWAFTAANWCLPLPGSFTRNQLDRMPLMTGPKTSQVSWCRSWKGRLIETGRNWMCCQWALTAFQTNSAKFVALLPQGQICTWILIRHTIWMGCRFEIEKCKFVGDDDSDDSSTSSTVVANSAKHRWWCHNCS